MGNAYFCDRCESLQDYGDMFPSVTDVNGRTWRFCVSCHNKFELWLYKIRNRKS